MITTIGVGLPYPSLYPEKHGDEFAIVDFFNTDYNRILIGSNRFTPAEIELIRFGKIKIGLYYSAPVLLIVVDIGFIVFDCPFNIKLCKNPVIPTLENDQTRLLIELHCINSHTNIVNGLRAFTLSPETSRDLINYAIDQNKFNYSNEDYVSSTDFIQTAYTTDHIAGMSNLKEVGL